MLHNSCNQCTCVLPDMCTSIPRAAGLRDSGVHIRQNTCVRVTTIKCIPNFMSISLANNCNLQNLQLAKIENYNCLLLLYSLNEKLSTC